MKVEVKVCYRLQHADSGGFLSPARLRTHLHIDAIMFPFYSGLGCWSLSILAEMGTDAYYENLLSAFTAEDGTVYCIPQGYQHWLPIIISVCWNPWESARTIYRISLEDYKDFLVIYRKLDEKYGKGQVAAMTLQSGSGQNIYILEAGGYSVSDDNGNAG